VAVVGWVSFAGERGLPAQEGIVNFGKVSETLYRGAQPDELGIQNLKRMGVKLIINLRMPEDSWKPEEAAARDCGITFTNVPFKGLGRPSDQQVRTVLAMIQSSTSPVFIHCRHGCDRTGTIVACYRIQHDGWTTDAALKEAKRYGMSRFERGMRSYVMDFGSHTKSLATAVVK
jgi:uncharacterized protein (TIGR01244 family)